MTDDSEIPSVFYNNRTTDTAPLFTCSLKLEKYDYEKKVSAHLFILLFIIKFLNILYG